MKLSHIADRLGARLHGPDADVVSVSTDTRTIKPGELFIALRGPNFDAHDFIEQAAERGAVAAIVSDVVEAPLSLIRVNDSKLALAELAAYHREQINIPIIAVTGSCGKTTTRALLASIFRQCGNVLASESSFNNDIGVPLTLLRLQPEHDFAVIEMGANHPGEIAYLTHLVKPAVAIITNAGPAHLEGFGDLEGVACAKGEIFRGLEQDGCAIINNDDRYAALWRSLLGSRPLLTFGIHHSADVMASGIRADDKGRPRFQLVLPTGEMEVHLPLMGEHNISNALAAATAAVTLDVPIESIKAGLESVAPVKGRLVERKGYNGCTIIDDSYNANPSSVTAAIKVLAGCAGDSVLVFGDMLELGEGTDQFHQSIGEEALRSGITRLYCYGAHSRYAAQAFGNHAYHFDTQDELVKALKDYLHENATVLVKGSKSMGMNKVTQALLED